MKNHHHGHHQQNATAQPVAPSAPSHDEIVPCARELWEQQGCPADRDEAIWLEAESRMLAARRGATRTLPAVGSVR